MVIYFGIVCNVFTMHHNKKCVSCEFRCLLGQSFHFFYTRNVIKISVKQWSACLSVSVYLTRKRSELHAWNLSYRLYTIIVAMYQLLRVIDNIVQILKLLHLFIHLIQQILSNSRVLLRWAWWKFLKNMSIFEKERHFRFSTPAKIIGNKIVNLNILKAHIQLFPGS